TGIRFVEYGSASQQIAAYRNRAIEAVCLTLDEVLVLAEDEERPAVVLVMDTSRGADVLLGRGPVRTMADLRGRRVGVDNMAVEACLLSRARETAGLAASEIELVALELPEMERAFREQRDDAVVTAEPVRSRLLAEGATILFDSSRIPGEIIDVLL